LNLQGCWCDMVPMSSA